MKDEKEPLEQKQNSEEEEYSFLQEIIKDEAGDQAKWKHDVLRRIQLGLIFGLVACIDFFHINTLWNSLPLHLAAYLYTGHSKIWYIFPIGK